MENNSNVNERLTAFLEGEKEIFDFNWYKDDVKRKLYEGQLDRSYLVEKMEDHDTRLINFVLDIVGEEIEKEITKEYQCQKHNQPRSITANNYDCTDIHIGSKLS